jgi:anti-sigma B factor antagonist
MTSLRYLSINTSDTPAGVCVRLAGVLDFGVRDQFADTVQCLLTRTPQVVEVDVADLRLLDAAGIATLIRVQQQARQHGCDLVVTNPRGMVARVLAITDTTPVLTHHCGPRCTSTSN